MAKSKGQDGGRGHSGGAFGHGGHHPKHTTDPGIPSHKSDHMRSMVSRGDAEMNGGSPGGMFGPQVQ